MSIAPKVVYNFRAKLCTESASPEVEVTETVEVLVLEDNLHNNQVVSQAALSASGLPQ